MTTPNIIDGYAIFWVITEITKVFYGSPAFSTLEFDLKSAVTPDIKTSIPQLVGAPNSNVSQSYGQWHPQVHAPVGIDVFDGPSIAAPRTCHRCNYQATEQDHKRGRFTSSDVNTTKWLCEVCKGF